MSNDFSTITNLQQRVSYMENTIGFLMNEVQRLTQNNTPLSQGFQTAIPLQPVSLRRPYQTTSQPINSRPITQFQPRPHDENTIAIPLNEIINKDEVVTFGIHTGRDVSGNLTTSTVVSTFDGTDLTITECATVPSLVGFKSSKPGEILFKFMGALKDVGILQRTFNALPWRLASVMRDGQRVTLSQLRRDKQGLGME